MSSSHAAALGSLLPRREAILEEARRDLDDRASRGGTNAPAAIVDPLVDGFFRAADAGDAEAAAATLSEMLETTGIPLDGEILALEVVRRALVRHVLASGEPEVGGAAASFVEDVVERVSTSLARQSVAALGKTRHALEHHDWMFQNLPTIMHSIDAQGRISAVNDRWIETLGYTRDEALGRRSTEFLTPESARYAREIVLPAFFKTGRCDNVLYQFVRKDGSLLDVMLSAIADRDEAGNVIRSQAVLTDVTEQLAAERAAQAAAAQEETIRAQRDMLRAISTPLVPLGDGVLLMPLVGTMDSARAEQMMAALLDGVVTHAAEVAILDVTGVPSVDASVAEALVRATKAVGLLGARVVLTGLGPSAAHTLVELDMELGGMTTKATLRDGLAAARKRARH
ncbi:PAS domain S-box protein [Polyangium jinanense]|uniref:PAS domain S-box protein n=1 Tax=Polyangium jinanense TaxID=2829994 RepID=A0A9X3WZR7_9BACT|nr:PAS domain S-box protein [Polyangium jinanense]MDC3952557.1 PAS domain S-box protein [Polyangium jinanense]MDC3980185.1 PAS domain S-box protein [Polyangium jinanense]